MGFEFVRIISGLLSRAAPESQPHGGELVDSAFASIIDKESAEVFVLHVCDLKYIELRSLNDMHNMRMFLRTGVKSVEHRLVVHEDIKAMSYNVAKWLIERYTARNSQSKVL